MRRAFVLAAAVLVAASGLVLAPAPPASAAAPFCGITWGSLPRSIEHSRLPGTGITNVRAGQHPCFDRLVIDGPGNRLFVKYVSQVREDPSDRPVHLAGGAFLQITVQSPELRAFRLPSVAGFRTFRQVAHAGSFEGVTTYGLGVRARLPFRVFALAGPGSGSRLVIDVAHRWQ